MNVSRRVIAALLFACVVILPALPASAATPPGTKLAPGWYIQGGTITRAGIPPRHLSASHAAAFIQAWYPATIVNGLKFSTPPASLPVSTVVIDDNINGFPYKFKAFYAFDGKKAWVGMPPQEVGPGAIVPKKVWFAATPRTILAFDGKVDPLPTGGPDSTPPTTAAPASSKTKSSGNGAAGSIVAGVVVLVLIGLVGLIFSRSRSQRGRK